VKQLDGLVKYQQHEKMFIQILYVDIYKKIFDITFFLVK
jgi:hypothetical protein